MSDIRSELLKKYNVGAAGKSSSSTKQNSVVSTSKTVSSGHRDYRSELLEKYSPEKTEQRRSAVSSWIDRYNKVMQGVSAYDTKRNGGYTSDASGGFSSEIDSLIADFDGIKEYADRDGLPNAQRYLRQLQGLRSSVNSINEHMSQFEDEDAYNRYMEYWKDQEEKKNLDLDAYSREIAALEQQLEDYTPEFNWDEDKYRNLNPQQIADAEIKRMQDEINRRKQYLTQAMRVQKQAAKEEKFSQVSKRADFAEKSGYDSSRKEIGYQYVNADTAGRLDLERKYGDYAGQFGDHAWDSLSDEEKAIYNYYMNTGDQESAAEYLRYVEEYVQTRKGTETDAYVDNLVEENPNAKILRYAFMANMGLDQHKTSMQDFGHMISGKDAYIPANATQYAGALMREDMGEDGKKLPEWLGGGSTGQMVGDMISTSANMAPSILASTVVGLLNPGAGAAVGKGMMSAGAAGSGYRELINEGYTKEQARLYGLGLGAAEYFMESALGGISKLGGLPAKAIAKWAANVDNAILKLALRLGGSGASEGLEEGLQEVISGWLKSKITHEDFYAEPADVMYSSLLGMATGVLFEAPSAIGSAANNRNANVYNINAGVDNVTETFDNATAALEKSTPDGVVKDTLTTEPADTEENLATELPTSEESTAVDNKMSATGESTGNAHSNVGVSKMEKTIQLTPDIESFSQQFGEQAEYVRRNFLEGQDLDLREDQDVALREYEIGFQAAFMIGKAGKKEALTSENVPYLSQSQREIAYQMGVEAAAAQKVAVSKVEGSEIETAAVPGGTNRAVQISTGKEVEIAKISNVDGNGGMTFRLSDGRTVEASDIQYGTESESVLYESVADLGASAEVSNKLVNTWRENPGGVSAETYAAGMMEAFNYGRYNIPETEMEQSETIQPLTVAQRSTAYQLGKTHGSELVQTKEANIRRAGALAKAQKTSRMAAQQTVTATSAGNSRVTATGAGKVHFDRQGRTLSAVQETGLKTMEQLSQLFGTEFHVFESYEKDGKRVFRDENGQEQAAPNGWYDPKTGHIHIDLNAGSGGRGTMLFTVAHELTHFIRDWSPAKFDKLAEAVFELVYKEKNTSVVELVRKQQAKAARNGMELSFDEAYEEVVADSMESILTSGNVVELMAEVKQRDQSLWQKIRKWFQDLAEDIRKMIDAYAGYKPDSAEGRAVAAMEEMLPVIESFYMDALQEASANYQAAEGQKNTTQEGGKKNSFAGRSAATADHSALQQAKQLQEQGVDNETIRQRIGWFKGMDGKWRFEIDDSQMEISENISNYMRLGDLMQHEKLYAAYPDMADIDVVFQSLDAGVNGSYHPQFDSINLSYRLKNDPIGLKDALVHEIQHAIQQREGFTKGATAESWERKIKAGFDSRRAEDIRKAQETERELRRIQEEEPEFYRDMVELDAMTPDLPRGEIDWETLEKIEDDPVEWQQYDARREELEAKYGDTKVWDMNDLLYQREQAAKNVGRSGVELYFDTAGEIEARDASNRRGKSPEQRKSSPPRLGNEDTVFAEGNAPTDDYIPGDVAESELENGINEVAAMSPISAISGTEFTTEGRTLLDDVDRFFKSVGGQVYNSRLGDINLTRRGVKDSLAHGMTPQKAAAFAAIPDVLRDGKVVGFEKNWKHRGYDSATIAAPITIGGEEYLMAVVVHRSNSANRFYVHDVFTAKKEATPFMTGTQNLGEPGGATSTISIIRKILSVKEKQAEANKKFSQRDPLQEKALTALEKENAQLREDVSRLRELVKLQGKVTNGTRFKRSSVEAAAIYLKKLFRTGGDTKELVDKLKDFYEYMASESELTLETVQEHAAPIILWLQENEKFQRSQHAQEVLDTLKGQSFYLDETQQQEAASQYGNLANYRRAVKNMVSGKAGQSLDQLWHELSGQYPDVFRPDTNASDMPLMFADALDMLENMGDTETTADWMMKDQTMLEELIDSFWRVDRLATVADRYEKKINELRWKHEQQMKQLRRNRDSALAELRADKKAAVETVRDNRDRATIRGKIRKTMRKLDLLLKSETKEKHVPDSMKKAVAEALSLMNDMELGTADKRMLALRHEIRDLESNLEQAEEQQNRELAEDIQAQLDEKYLALQRYEKSGGRLTALRDAYTDIRNSTDPDIAAGYDAEVAGALAELADSIKDTSFRDMSKDQLQDVLDMYTMVLTRIRDANKQLGARRGETLQENAAETEADIRKFGISEKDPGVVADKLGKLVRGFSWNNLRPVDAFHRLGSRKLEQLYMDLVDGMAQRGRQIKEIGQFITDIRKKTGYKSFDLKEAETYTTVDGKEMKLTLAEKMSIYAYSKRDQAYDHMAEGGFTYAKDLTYKEKGKTKVHTGKAKTWRLSMEDLHTICGSLTEKQRQYVDAVQQFLTEFGIHGDKVNMELYGIKLFNKEKSYFPLQSDRDYRKSVENQLGGTMTAASLKNDGMTKKTVPGANNPIVLEDFDRVVFRHLDKMVNYANLVLPLENLRRVFDYQTSASENQAPASMKALIGATFGREAQQYVEQFLTDANGTRMSMGVQNPLEIMFTRSKGMAVAANLSVMIQQISAVVRAGAEISPKHLMWAAENRKGVKLYDEMVEYAPIAIIKDMGGFDTGSNRSLEDYIGFEEAPNSAKKMWNSMQKLFGMGAEIMDKVGWCLIWNGVKREVASRQQYEVNSEEFLQECGKRFTEVIVKTQVYDSVLSRSGYMRDKHGTMRYLTSFMGEPTVQAGMVFNSHLDVVRAIQQKKDVRLNVKRLIRRDAALISALVVNGMLKAIPYAMRDDDEDEGYWERWAKQFGSALSELWKPWELLPILRNIDDLASGRTIEQPDMALLSDLLQVGTKVIHVMQDEEAMADMKPDDWYALAKELAGSVGNLLGVPVKNIWRDAEGYVRIWKDATDGIDSDGMLLDALWRGLKGEEKTKHEGIYDAMLSGDTARLNALKATYKTDGSYESAVRKALRLHDPRIKEMANARYEGDYDRLEVLSYEIEAEGIFDMATIRAAYEAERTAQAKERGITLEEDSAAEQGEESTVFSMEEYYAAIRSGSKDSIQTAYNALIEEKKQEYYLEREAEDSIASSVTSKVKGEYLDEDISRADAKAILTKYGRKSKAEAETEIKKWEFQMEYHYAWGSRDRCYRSGTITRSQLVSAVMDIEDTSREEAQEYVDFLDLEMKNQDVDITASEASSYFEHAKPHGISVEVYLDYKARTKGIQNDKDANGDSIPYTAVQKIMTEIDKLPISSNQKYALARSNGWAEKTIQKYKKW